MSFLIHFFNLVSFILPSRSYFLRARLLKVCGVKLGKKVCFNSRTSLYGNHIEISDFTWIGIGCTFISNIKGSIIIGKNVDIGPSVLFVTGSHHLGQSERRAGNGISLPINIGDGCWIGANSTILGGASIGEGCIVAAGSVVVSGSYPANILLAGVPAVIKKQFDEGNE